MRHAAGSLLCALGLAGCAATPAPYGNFVREGPAGYDRTVAEDGVRQLAAIYPPANTRFELQQPTPDAFGKLLTASLRAKGYAVRESAASGSAATAAPALPLRYVLDQASGLYRITLHVGSQSLTRAYLAQNGALQPAGAWVRKE
jgi:hypothetical protein